MKKTITTLTLFAALIGIEQQTQAQFVVTNDTTFKTADQMLLANELFESGEPFAEALGYNLDILDPGVLNIPDTAAYTFGIENYEYSRYLLSTLTGRSGLGLHMMWSPIIKSNAAMQTASFDGMFTGGMTNGYKEDDMLMMMIGNFGANANQAPPMNAFPQFADFVEGNTNLPQAVAANLAMDFGTTRWNRSKMTKTLNLGAMGQSMWKQYYWAQDMLSAFHDSLDNGIVPTGTNSPDSVGSPNLDPNNNIFYGGNSLDGYIGQVLTAVSINKTKFLVTNLAYDGTTLGMVDPATYDPANGIKYFPTAISITETPVATGLPPEATAFSVIDNKSQLFDQLSYLLATTSFKNMMNPTDNSDAAHLAYHTVFDGNPFPADMATTGMAGPFDLMKGTSKIIFLNIMAMHYNSTENTFVDESSLDNTGAVVSGNVISAENAGYILVALSKFSTEFVGTPLQATADAAIIAQTDYILSKLKDPSGGFYSNYTIGTGAPTSSKTMQSNAAIIRGLYAAYQATNNNTYLTEANAAYNYLVNNFYQPFDKIFLTTLGNTIATYTPKNLGILSGALREATLVGSNTEASAIYARVFKSVYNKMIIAEAGQTGESGNDSDGDGIPFIVGGTKPFVFAAEGVYTVTATSVTELKEGKVEVKIYPNPATDYISIQTNLVEFSTIDIAIYDITGRQVFVKQNISMPNGVQKMNIPLNEMVTGNYFVKISVNNEPLHIEKLIIK